MRSKFFVSQFDKKIKKERKKEKNEIEAVYKMLHFKFKSSACIQYKNSLLLKDNKRKEN